MDDNKQVKQVTFIMTCSSCPKKLSGGIDTFGSIQAPVCIDCFFGENEKSKMLPLMKKYENLESERDRLQWEIDGLEEELRDVENKMYDMQDDFEEAGTTLDELRDSLSEYNDFEELPPKSKEQLRNFWVVAQ